jgi:hypothetical protein
MGDGGGGGGGGLASVLDHFAVLYTLTSIPTVTLTPQLHNILQLPSADTLT